MLSLSLHTYSNEDQLYPRLAERLALTGIPGDISSRELVLFEIGQRHPQAALEYLLPQYKKFLDDADGQEEKFAYLAGVYAALEHLNGEPISSNLISKDSFDSNFFAAFLSTLRNAWRLGAKFSPETLQELSFYNKFKEVHHRSNSCLWLIVEVWDPKAKDSIAGLPKSRTYDLIPALSDLSPAVKQLPVEERIHLFCRLSETTEYSNEEDAYWMLLFQYQLLPRNELVNHLDTILKNTNMPMEELFQLGTLLRQQGAHEEAIQVWDFAESKRTQTDDPEILADLRFNQASMLIRTNQVARAKKVIIKLSNMKNSSQRERITNLIKISGIQLKKIGSTRN
jgi:hypothetical protein